MRWALTSMDDGDDEEAKTVPHEQGAEPIDGEELPPGSLPGLDEILGANRRGELHQLGPGMIIDGKWELRSLLGKGSFGEVYEAWHLKLDHPVAIKVLAGEHGGADVRQRFLDEARLMAGMSSEHLVRASDFGELPDGSPYFVMDLVKGKPLRHCLKERLPTWRAVAIAEEILEGLVEVHKRGVVHGDIKPENVVIGDDDDKARLLDFGLAQTSAAEGEDVGGTPHYMAPEMLLERAPANARTDVYAVGVVLYEMLTGRLPRGHLDMGAAKLRAAWESKPKPNPVLMHCKDVPEGQREALEALDKLVMEALAREPIARPKSALPMLEELRRLRKRLSPEALAPTLVSESKAAGSLAEARTTQRYGAVGQPRWWRVWLAVAVVVVVVMSILGWWGWPKETLREVLARKGAMPPIAEEMDDSFGVDAIQAARDGILVAMPEQASDATKEGYAAVCRVLGGDRPIMDGELRVQCRSVPVGVDALLALAEEVEAKVVVFVGEGGAEEIVVRTTSHHRGNALLARLDGLPLPKDPEAMALVAPILRAVVDANMASGKTGAGARGAEIPVFDWKKVGARWGGLAEWLRVQQEHESPKDLERRKELALELEDELAKARGRKEEAGAAYHRDLAMLVWATSLSCDGSERLLDDLGVAGKHSGIRVAALLERVDCLLEGNDPASKVGQAKALLAEVFAASGDDPCVRVEAIGSVSWIDVYERTSAGWDAHAKRLPGPEKCEAWMWSKAYAVRGDTLVDRGDWCEAAKAYALAHEALRTKAEPLLNWAEYDWKCDPKGRTSRQGLLDGLREALASEAFERPEQRVSIAYMRWWLTRDPADAQRVLDEHAKVRVGDAALLEDVGSDLEGEICAGVKADACSLRILGRDKRAEDAERLRTSLGLR